MEHKSPELLKICPTLYAGTTYCACFVSHSVKINYFYIMLKEKKVTTVSIQKAREGQPSMGLIFSIVCIHAGEGLLKQVVMITHLNWCKVSKIIGHPISCELLCSSIKLPLSYC